jgi:hypothetical protein
VGSSPSAAAFLPYVAAEAITISTNRGIELFNAGIESFAGRRLDYYLLFDDAACRAYVKRAYEKQADGTKLITHTHQERQVKEFGLGGFDITLPMATPTPPLFVRGKYTVQLGISGMYCLAFAVNNGAKRVVMMGMEGYENHQAGKVTLIIRPVTQAIIDACPDVQFEFCGRPRYVIGGKNLRIYHNPQDYRATHEDQNAQAVSCA